MEISDWQASAGLLALPCCIFTDKFSYGNVHSVIATREEMETSELRDGIENDICDRAAEAQAERDRESGKKRRFHLSGDYGFISDDGSEENDEGGRGTTSQGDGGIDPPTESPSSEAEKQVALRHRDLGHVSKVVVVKKTEDTKQKCIVVPTAMLFHTRGKELEKMSYYEYLGCVLFMNQPCPAKQRLDKRTSRKFAMESTFEGHFNCCHALKQKQCTPLLNGKVPSLPGKKPCSDDQKQASWQERADRFAAYYLTLFRPCKAGDGQGYSWEDLEDYVSFLQNDPSALSKFRLMTMDQHMQGLSSYEVSRKMTLEYRARARKLWTKAEKASREGRGSWGEGTKDMSLLDLLEQISGKLSSRRVDGMQRQLGHDALQIRSIEEAFAEKREKLSQVTTLNIKKRSGISFKDDAATVQMKCKEMRQWKSESVQEIKPMSGATLKQKLVTIRNRLSKDGGKNTQQLELFDEFCEYLKERHDDPDKTSTFPRMLLIHGCPGVGKSKLRDAICEVSEAYGNFNLKTAFNAMNAAEMGGYTTAFLVKLNSKLHKVRYADTKRNMIVDLQREGFDVNSLVVLDECSTQAPWHVAAFERFCQHANGRLSEDMGGNAFASLGDFTQLGPVKAGKTIPQAVADIYGDEDVRAYLNRNKRAKKGTDNDDGGNIREDENCPYHKGATLFTKLRWFEMTQQHRSGDDVHTDFVESNYRGEDIDSGKVYATYQELSQSDMHEKKWINASVLVSTNRERCSLTHVRAIHYAAYNGTTVIRWRKDIKADSWEGRPDPVHMDEVYDDPCFYEYFVPGAEGFLTESYNRDLKLVNAMPVKYRTIKFESNIEKYLAEELKRAKPGDVITVPGPPICINVEIEMPENVPNDIKAKLAEFSVDKKKVVVPIQTFSCKWDSAKTTVRGGPGFDPCKVMLRQRMPLELGFAITVHKSEGRTIRNIIIALSCTQAAAKCDFSYEQVHVAFSRVAHRQDVRLLLAGRHVVAKRMSLSYLARLRPDASVFFYFAGFRDTYQKKLENPNENWKTNEWCPKRANAAFRRRFL